MARSEAKGGLEGRIPSSTPKKSLFRVGIWISAPRLRQCGQDSRWSVTAASGSRTRKLKLSST
jgi:hypothetical protein